MSEVSVWTNEHRGVEPGMSSGLSMSEVSVWTNRHHVVALGANSRLRWQEHRVRLRDPREEADVVEVCAINRHGRMISRR
jgi:hypothetical protein